MLAIRSRICSHAQAMANHLQARDCCKQHDKYMGTAFGIELRGANYVLGQVAFYRTESQYKPKLDPNASPAPMAGWKLEFGLRLKPLLDYQALREGKIVCVQAPDQVEIYRKNAGRV